MLNDTKACTKCGDVKPLTEFGKDRRRKDGHNSRCKACLAAWQRAYRKTNPEKIASRNRAYYAKNRDELLKSMQAYGVANREKIAARLRANYRANPEKVIAYNRGWRAANPQKKADQGARRRARQQSNGLYVISNKDMARLYASPCAECGSRDNITADHIIPIIRKGRHSIGNLQPLCLSCNASKQDRLLIEWRAWKAA